MVRRVAAGADDTYAWPDLPVVIDEVDDAHRLERREVLLKIAAAAAVVRSHRIVPFATADDVLRPSESRRMAAPLAHHGAAEVVEVQVRRQDDVDRLRRHTGFCERVIDVTGPIEPEDLGPLGVEL